MRKVMEKDKGKPSEHQEQGSRAERHLADQRDSSEESRQNARELKRLHELQVHQVELEMQNEELRKVRAELHASLDRFTTLYELSPVVLLTLDADGSITESNQAAAALLGVDPPVLLMRRLGSFVVAGSLQAFNACLDTAFETGSSKDCEVELLRDDGTRLFTQITLILEKSKSTCLAALVDITLRHELLHENRQLTRRMFELLEGDRRNLAREIHDELGQWLTGINAATASMIRVEHRLQPETRANIRAVNANTAEMQNVLRRILLRLRPTMLDTVGLGEGLRELLYQWGERHKTVAWTIGLGEDIEGLGETLNITIFRIVQEALTNIAKHANARNVNVSLDRTTTQASSPTELVLNIHDDGNGFDPTVRTPGLGLLGMRERVIALEGRFEVSSRPDHGTTIRARFPNPGKSQPAPATSK